MASVAQAPLEKGGTTYRRPRHKQHPKAEDRTCGHACERQSLHSWYHQRSAGSEEQQHSPMRKTPLRYQQNSLSPFFLLRNQRSQSDKTGPMSDPGEPAMASIPAREYGPVTAADPVEQQQHPAAGGSRWPKQQAAQEQGAAAPSG
jgi:hypothetical protein